MVGAIFGIASAVVVTFMVVAFIVVVTDVVVVVVKANPSIIGRIFSLTGFISSALTKGKLLASCIMCPRDKRGKLSTWTQH